MAVQAVDNLIKNIDDKKDDKENSQRFKLGYWKIQGLGGVARMMFVYAGVAFDNVMYTQLGKEDNYSRAEWNDKKFKLGLSFPNLPYLFDTKNNLNLTESQAIYRYLSRELGIGPKASEDMAKVDMLAGVIADSLSGFTRLSYGTYPDGKDDYLKNQLPSKMTLIDKYLNGKKYLCGDKPSYADFMLYYAAVANLKLDKNSLADFKNVLKFYKEFDDGFVKKWNKSGYSDLPLNNTVAKFR